MSYLASRRQQRHWLQTAGLGDILSSYPASVERWRALLNQYRGDIPLDFLLAWLKKESNGDVCSYTSLRESGIFQLMPPDNTNVAGTTEAALRASCTGGSGTQSRPLTAAETQLQVASGIQYVKWARDQARKKLAAAGANWSESSPDFWMMVKLQHAYPGPTAMWLAASTAMLGRPPKTWKEFRSAISGYAGVLDNAEEVGGAADVSGGGGDLPVLLALGAGLGLLYILSR